MYSPFKAIKGALIELLELILIPAEFLIATIGIDRKVGFVGLLIVLIFIGFLLFRYL